MKTKNLFLNFLLISSLFACNVQAMKRKATGDPAATLKGKRARSEEHALSNSLFNMLPDELIAKIFHDNLNARNIANTAKVCSHFRAVTQTTEIQKKIDKKFFRQLLKKYYPDHDPDTFISQIQNLNHPINSIQKPILLSQLTLLLTKAIENCEIKTIRFILELNVLDLINTKITVPANFQLTYGFSDGTFLDYAHLLSLNEPNRAEKNQIKTLLSDHGAKMRKFRFEK